MKIILANGVELEPIVATGSPSYVQGANRDTLSFVFAEDTGLEALDKAFTEEACESITVVESQNKSYIHKGYTIRAGLTKGSVAVSKGDTETDTVYENRITVTMAQRTYAETKLATLAAESTDTQIAVAELAEIIMPISTSRSITGAVTESLTKAHTPS